MCINFIIILSFSDTQYNISFVVLWGMVFIYIFFHNKTKTRMTVTRPDEYGVEETVTELVPGKLLLLIVCCACVVKYQTCIGGE